jgi:hypothetical protein
LSKKTCSGKKDNNNHYAQLFHQVIILNCCALPLKNNSKTIPFMRKSVAMLRMLYPLVSCLANPNSKHDLLELFMQRASPAATLR